MIKLGIDTEVVAATARGMYWPHLAGLKQERESLDKEYDWHADGFAWELCVQPSSDPWDIMKYVASGIDHLTYEYGIEKIVAPSIYQVPVTVVKEAPAEVKRLGCMPSFNIYPGQHAVPGGLGKRNRTTGCHLHVSAPEIGKENYAAIVAWADIFVGGTWTSISPESLVDERLRRKYYGRAGEHRVRYYDRATKLFGVEYRSLPGTVLHHPVYLHLMLRLMKLACQRALTDGMPPESLTNLAVQTINKAYRKSDILDQVGPMFSMELHESIEHARYTRAKTLDVSAWREIK